MVAATNRPELIDTALLRPGRFDLVVELAYPNEIERRAIFAIHTKGRPLTSEITMEELASLTEGRSGADIEAVCDEAAEHAYRRTSQPRAVCEHDFQAVLRRRLPQIGPGTNYLSSIYVPDAGRAVAASLGVPAGVYNVCDDAPVPFAAYLSAVAASLGAPAPRRLPMLLGRLLFGEAGRFFFRSRRVSNRRFKAATGWTPTMASVLEGWPTIVTNIATKIA